MVDILFTSDYDEFLDTEDIRPQPAKNFIPKWYKDMPVDMPENHSWFVSKLIPNWKTTKVCPSFANIFHENTYVIVAPCDIHLFNMNGKWQGSTANPNVGLNHHEDDQFINHIPGKPIKAVFRLATRFHCMLPKGYSLRYIPLNLHFNTDWFATYGVIDQDKMTQLNVQILVTTDKEELLIKKGQPICYILPYKREKYKYKFKYMDAKLKKFIKKIDLITISRFKGGYSKSENHDYTKE